MDNFLLSFLIMMLWSLIFTCMFLGMRKTKILRSKIGISGSILICTILLVRMAIPFDIGCKKSGSILAMVSEMVQGCEDNKVQHHIWRCIRYTDCGSDLGRDSHNTTNPVCKIIYHAEECVSQKYPIWE